MYHVQLHKDDPLTVYYWQAWEVDGQLVVQRGEVGYPGETHRIEPAELEAQQAAALAEGYQVRHRSRMIELLVRWPQVPAEETEVLGALTHALWQVGGGWCQRHPPGPGTYTAALLTVDPRLVMAKVMDTLKKRDWLRSVELGAPDDSGAWRVLFPPPYGRPFTP